MISNLLNNPTIAGILGSVFGVISGGFITYLFSVKLSRIQIYNMAATKLKSEFVDIIAHFDDKTYSGNEDFDSFSNHIYAFLNEEYPKLAKAYISFRSYLGKNERKLFDQAWHNFLYPIGPVEKEGKREFRFIGYNNEDGKQKLLRNIKWLLDYAKLK